MSSTVFHPLIGFEITAGVNLVWQHNSKGRSMMLCDSPCKSTSKSCPKHWVPGVQKRFLKCAAGPVFGISQWVHWVHSINQYTPVHWWTNLPNGKASSRPLAPFWTRPQLSACKRNVLKLHKKLLRRVPYAKLSPELWQSIVLVDRRPITIAQVGGVRAILVLTHAKNIHTVLLLRNRTYKWDWEARTHERGAYSTEMVRQKQWEQEVQR